MSASWEIGQRAYVKALLHALKHKANAINGVLLGTAEGSTVKVVDAIPLFHTQLALAPMLEVAMGQVEAYAAEKKLSIVGYYHANERLDDKELGAVAKKIADKIQSYCPSACVLLVDNAKIGTVESSKPELAVQVFEKETSRAWRPAAESAVRIPEPGMLQILKAYAAEGREARLVDFDDHLDDIKSDWANPTLFN